MRQWNEMKMSDSGSSVCFSGLLGEKDANEDVHLVKDENDIIKRYIHKIKKFYREIVKFKKRERVRN